MDPRGRTQYLVGLMRKSLAAYGDGRLDLASLAYDVESLVGSLDEVADEHWVVALRTVWWELEDVSASCLDEDRSPSQEELVAVGRSLESIERLLGHEW